MILSEPSVGLVLFLLKSPHEHLSFWFSRCSLGQWTSSTVYTCVNVIDALHMLHIRIWHRSPRWVDVDIRGYACE